jgi:hypothetical protein
MPAKRPTIPPERMLLANYKLWRRHVDPDGLVSASEFREMDDDEKRDALRELGGAHPAEAGADEPVAARGADDEEIEAALADDEEEEEGDDRFVELSDDIVDPRSE